MEHNSFPLEFELHEGKDALQTAQERYQLKIQSFLQMLSVVYMLSPPPRMEKM